MTAVRVELLSLTSGASTGDRMMCALHSAAGKVMDPGDLRRQGRRSSEKPLE
jgi:hypothetical protein